jgi:hypothetical protein
MTDTTNLVKKAEAHAEARLRLRLVRKVDALRISTSDRALSPATRRAADRAHNAALDDVLAAIREDG